MNRRKAPRITMTDVRKAGHCASGARRWFEGYGLDFRDFIKNGIDEKTFLATGDGLAEQVVARARRDRGDG